MLNHLVVDRLSSVQRRDERRDAGCREMRQRQGCIGLFDLLGRHGIPLRAGVDNRTIAELPAAGNGSGQGGAA